MQHRALASLLAFTVFGFVATRPAVAHADHIRDLADIDGARQNQLVGYGIVTGLSNSGDDTSAVPYTVQSVLAFLRRQGVQVDATTLTSQLRLRNVAAVIVTANIPPFARPGTLLDVTVSSIGTARSLQGGVLIQSVLKGPDQRAYAVAQGSLLVGGFEASGTSGSSVRSGTTTAGRITGGAIVEREIPTTMVTDGNLRLDLRIPGFTVASRVAEAINQAVGAGTATATDAGAVTVRAPTGPNASLVDFVARIEDIEVVPLRPARVVINERTGTIVAGGDVRLSPVAVVHGNLTIVVRESSNTSQPNANSDGQTRTTPQTEITTAENHRPIAYLSAAPTLSDVASALGTLGLSPRELASVMDALRDAGALEAEVVIQ